MEKNLSLTYEEATALLEMSLFTLLDQQGPAADSALRKLGDLCRELSSEEGDVDRKPVSQEFGCACGF